MSKDKDKKVPLKPEEIPAELNMYLEDILPEYAGLFGGRLEFGEPEQFVDVSGKKTYSYFASIPVQCGDEQAKIAVVAFSLYDGTGKKSSHVDLEGVSSQEKYKFPGLDGIPPQVIPRNKLWGDNTHIEIMFPFFSINKKDRSVYRNVVCLDEVTLRDKKIARDCLLGTEDSKLFFSQIRDQEMLEPRLYMTTGYLPGGSRFGDPHSTVFSGLGFQPDMLQRVLGDEHYFGNLIQLAGFLKTDKAGSPIAKLCDDMVLHGKVEIPTRYD
ncbi:hypothetical protein ACFL96_13300 [Thermoproteota archaeon]